MAGAGARAKQLEAVSAVRFPKVACKLRSGLGGLAAAGNGRTAMPVPEFGGHGLPNIVVASYF